MHMSIELQILFCAIILGLAQLLLATLASIFGRGFPWALGPRDEWPPLGPIGGRIERASRNFLETFGFFAVAVLMVNGLHLENAHTALGAKIYIWARLLYVPAYIAGIPGVRTLVFIASIAGIFMVLMPLLPH